MATARVGMRVVRGPDWPGDDSDGGEGHLGTVVSLLDGDRVRVLWDSGRQEVYRSGAEGKFDLRVFDTGPVGIQHPDSTCAACDERSIYGMLWRCKTCRACCLCPLCYVTDKHDIKHEFLRFDEPGHAGQGVKKRSISLKMRAVGIFPGAKVKRGKDWAWADQDGGKGSIGEVMGFENVAPDSSRNIVRVQWPNGRTNSYRLGFQGNVDIVCEEEEAGTYYYRDHLPVLRTSGGMVRSSSSPSAASDNSAVFAKTSSSPQMAASSGPSSASSSQASSASCGRPSGEISAVKVGDKVVMHVEEDRLKELQAKYGGCTATMLRCIGKQGEVVSFAPNGAAGVRFDKLTYRINPEAVMKVPSLSVGDMVRIRSDLEQVKLLNKRLTWKSPMEETLGKVGQVTKIDSDGDVVVSFGRAAFMYSPACCIPVESSASFDSIASSTSSGDGAHSSASTSSSDEGSEYGELHQDLMKMIAQMMGLDVRGSGGSGGQARGDAMERLLRAIGRGDLSTVRTLCQENTGLVNHVYKGMTPLIMACHEGQKDMCSCLLAQGADVNQKGDKGNTPLGAALEGKKEHIAIFLLEKGANPNVRNIKDRNPVHLAAYNNMPEAVKVLVQKGADPNAKDQFGDTPLHDAIERHNDEAIDMLLRVKSIDLQAQNKKGFNMLQLAALKGNAHAIERILSRDAGHVDKLFCGEYTALHIAANNDHVDCIKLLVKNGSAQIDLQGRKKLTALHMACCKGHIRSMGALLELGASVNLQDSDGDTPLHLAMGTKVDNPGSLQGQLELQNRVRMACILLSKGAYPDINNRKGDDPLECCPYPGFRSRVQQFMKENPGVIKRAGSSTARGGAQGTRRGVGLEAFLQGMRLPCGGLGCSRFSDITLMPCGHKALCRTCCLQTSECPLCHATIERRIHQRGDSVEVDMTQACKQM